MVEKTKLPLSAPVIFVDPGLTCTAQDVPGSALMRLAVSRGFRVVVMERRSHALPLKSPRWNLFGDSEDFEEVYNIVQSKLVGAPMFWIGLSSGSKLIVEGLGKFDDRRKRGDPSAPRFVAAACICPGYNLETCFQKFAWPFTKICLASVKDTFLMKNEAILRKHDAETFKRAMAAPDLQSLLALAAPFAGYPSAEAYFAAENPVLFAPLITTPTLIVNADDDPMTVVANAFAPSPRHEGSPTFVELLERSPCGMMLLSSSGSHCPFLDGMFWPFVRVPWHLGGLIVNCWAERCAIEFFEGYLAELKTT